MQLGTSYKQILSISIPIMLGSAAQNIIVLCDNVFLYHQSKTDFAAVGIVGVFYLIIASIGYGFSRGGQVLIARRHGEKDYKGVGSFFNALISLELLLAIIMFVILQFGSHWIFRQFIDDQVILAKCMEYIIPRSYGVFFSYLGVSFIALYTGVARTKFIIYDTVILTVVNVILNYIFIYGAFGMEPMGIAGAGWASTLAEVVAFLAFVIYMRYDIYNRKYRAFKKDNFHQKEMWQVQSVSLPLVLQSILGLGSWFIFFTLIENMGQRELEISNLIRNIYLILSIPCWGFSAGINTLVSHFIGQRKRQAVMPIIYKTAKLCFLVTAVISVPILALPEFFLYPLFGGDDMLLIYETKPFMLVLLIVVLIFSIGAIYMNGLIGTGHTRTALWIQALFTIGYVIYAYYVIKVADLGLNWAWATEIFYWTAIGIVVFIYLKSKKWHKARI